MTNPSAVPSAPEAAAEATPGATPLVRIHRHGEGGHVAESDQPFAIINVGYTNFTSYAYPGGMKLDVITPQ